MKTKIEGLQINSHIGYVVWVKNHWWNKWFALTAKDGSAVIFTEEEVKQFGWL